MAARGAAGSRVAPDVSVIIPARNNAHTIGAQLAALRRQRYEDAWEVIVVDNGSSDATCEVVRAYQHAMPNLVLVTDGRIPTAGYARNAGAAAARGKRFLFCDADDVVADDWLRSMAQALRQHEFVVGRVEVKQLNSGVEEDFGNNGLNDRLLNFLPYAIGCNFGVTRRGFERVGGFATNYQKCADVEFSWRLQLAGFALVEVPEAVVHYRYRRGAWAICKTAFLFSQAHAALFKEFSCYGARRSHAREIWWRYRNVLFGAARPWRWTPCRQIDWAFNLGVIVGRTCGSLRYRTFYP